MTNHSSEIDGCRCDDRITIARRRTYKIMSAYSELQRNALAIVPKVVSTFSIVGDTLILSEMFLWDPHGREKLRTRTLQRIIFGMTCYDFFTSWGLFLSSWPIPREEPNLSWNVGNTYTCVFQGWLIQWGISLPFYNLSLGTYYLLVIVYSWSERRLNDSKIEMFFFHSIPFLWALSTNVISVVLDLINSSNLWCWIGPPPESDPSRGQHYAFYRMALYYVPVWLIVVYVGGVMALVYRKFRLLERANERYQFGKVPNKVGNSSGCKIYNNDDSISNNKKDVTDRNSSLRTAKTSSTGLADPQEKLSGQKEMENERKRQQRLERRELARTKRSRQIAVQGLFWTGSFICTFLFPTTNRLCQLAGITRYELLLLHTVGVCSQGWLNFLVYFRPRLAKYHEENHKHEGIMGWLRSLKAVVWDVHVREPATPTPAPNSKQAPCTPKHVVSPNAGSSTDAQTHEIIDNSDKNSNNDDPNPACACMAEEGSQSGVTTTSRDQYEDAPPPPPQCSDDDDDIDDAASSDIDSNDSVFWGSGRVDTTPRPPRKLGSLTSLRRLLSREPPNPTLEGPRRSFQSWVPSGVLRSPQQRRHTEHFKIPSEFRVSAT